MLPQVLGALRDGILSLVPAGFNRPLNVSFRVVLSMLQGFAGTFYLVGGW